MHPRTADGAPPVPGRPRFVLPLVFALCCSAPVSAQKADITRPGAVTVFAAASLTAAFQSLAAERPAGDSAIIFNFGGSSGLVRQLEEGAPGDVFAAADEATMQQLVASGALAGEPQIFAHNRLQIAVAPGNPKHIAGLADLARRGMVVALCAPAVPAGRYAAEAFAKAGLVAPAASQETDVKAVVTKVALGEADAGVVYVTDVRAAGDRVAGVDIPPGQNVDARYPIAVLKHAANAGGARAFVDFVRSAAGRGVLARYGFLLP